MAEVIPGKTKNATKKLKKSSWKMRLKNVFSKCKKKAKKKLFQEDLRISQKRKKATTKQKKSCTCWKNAFFSHLEIAQKWLFSFCSAKCKNKEAICHNLQMRERSVSRHLQNGVNKAFFFCFCVCSVKYKNKPALAEWCDKSFFFCVLLCKMQKKAIFAQFSHARKKAIFLGICRMV